MLDFAVVGAGPVGLLCALALRRLGRSVTLLERCRVPRGETRSIGIHVASLVCLDQLDLLAPFVASGVRIERGLAVGSRGLLGKISFADASARFSFALAIPQAQTEALLERANQAAGVQILRAANTVALEQHGDHVSLAYDRSGRRKHLAARYLLACDGSNSSIREMLGVTVRRFLLAGSYMMAEFANTPRLANDAWIFLADQGLVESFPLPGDRRRWVVEAPARREQVDLDELCALVRERCGHTLDPRAGEQASAFGVSQSLAQRLLCDRVLLLGDAAHTLSPFGGQGMNLGWFDAVALANIVARRWTPTGVDHASLEDWARQRSRAARVALRHAAWNTRIGRRTALPRVRNALVRLALSRPFAARWSRRIAMLSLAPSESPS